MTNQSPSKLTIIRKRFELKDVWTTTELYKELKIIFPEVEDKILRHRVRSSINSLRQQNEVQRIAPSKWKKI